MYKKSLPILFSFLIPIVAISQNDYQNKLDSFTGKFIAAIRSENKQKALVTTDKSVYQPGENIWVKALVVNSVSQKVNTINDFLFVDLVDEKDSVISTVLLDATTQQVTARIPLKEPIPGGYYWVRAYTRKIAEKDPANIAVQPILVTGARSKSKRQDAANSNASNTNTKPVITFYPEGGIIITGASSVIAFTIKDGAGNPIQTEGYVKDSRDTTVAKFSSDKMGIGKFSMEASSFRTYKAFLQWNGSTLTFPMPAFNLFGGQIAITNQPEGNKLVRVLLEDKIFKPSIVSYVVGISKDSLCFAAIGHGQYELQLPKQKFPAGIANVYLFDESLKLLSERSVYFEENNIAINAATDKNAYLKREKVSLNISVNDADNRPVSSLFSIAVTDSAFSSVSEDVSSLINEPEAFNNFILEDNHTLSPDYIDNLMLLRNPTFEIKNKITASNSTNVNDSLLYIKGIATDEKGKPASNKILTLLTDNGGMSFFSDTTDQEGHFSFAVTHFPDSSQFAIEAKNADGKSTSVNIQRDPTPFPVFKTPSFLKHHFIAEPVFAGRYKSAYFDTLSLETGKRILKPVTVTGKKGKEVNYNEALRVSSSSTVLTPDQMDERMSLGNIILTVGGLHLLQGFIVINGLTAMSAPNASSEPLLIIDGVNAPIVGSNGDESPLMATLNSISPKDVEFVEILKNGEGSNYGVRGGNGVILINMVKSRRQLYGSKGNMQTFFANGISRPALFPNKLYETKEQKKSEETDNRSTLYWNGNYASNATNPPVTFYTNDIPGTYKITLTGISVHGDLLKKTVFFTNK